MIGVVEHFEAGLVARGDDVIEAQLLRPATVIETEAHAAALCDHRHAPAAERHLRQQGQISRRHRRAEGRAERERQIGEALGVRAHDGHAVLGGNGLDLGLLLGAGLARLLGKAGAQHDDGADARLTAAAQLVDDELGWNDEHREIDRPRHGADGRVRLQALHFTIAAAHRIDRAGIGVRGEDFEDAPAQALPLGGSANNSNIPRREKLCDIGHCSTYLNAGRDRAR